MYKISNTVERKFIDSIDISDFQIESESGWVDIESINVTVDYDVWRLTTNNTIIECADTHIVFDENHNEIFVKDLKIGDKIVSSNGFDIVLEVIKTDKCEPMIDLSVGGSHTFYAHNILHHNTTVSAAYFVWYIIFNDNKSVAIFANKQSTADEIMSRIRRAYENLPLWIQGGVKTWNKRSIELENDSLIYGRATSGSGNRGGSVNILYLDEYAWVPNNMADEFFTSVYPSITAGKDSKVFCTSTPNGYNHFYSMWNDAGKSKESGWNGFTPLRVYWHETPGRDQAWYDSQKAILGELKAAQELDANFLGSSLTLLSGNVLARLSYDTPIKEYSDNFKGLKIYSNYVKGNSYTISVDTSRGRHLDYSAFTVFDITSYPHKIVATYRNNEIAPLLYASILHHIGMAYNNAYMLIEINDIGGQVAETLWYDLEYENMFWTKGDMLGKEGNPYPGIRTTTKTKRVGCANLKDMIDSNKLLICDADMISELSTFIQSANGSYAADEGFHDDTVMTLVLHAWLSSQPWFSDLTNSNLRIEMHGGHISGLESELCMPLYSDGNESYDTSMEKYDWF